MVRQSGREKSSRGFTLVEMAMVLVIVGLLIGVGAPLLRTLVTNIKYSQSRDIVQAAVDSVESWTAGNNLIPGTSFSTVVKNPNDAFAQPLIYVYDFNASGGNNITNICGLKTTTLSLKPSATANTIYNVAFVVLSEADDHKVDSTVVSTGGATCGSAIPPAGCTDGAPGNPGNVTITADTANDIVQWVTIDELRTKVGCKGAELTILNTELPYAYGASTIGGVMSYSVTVYADGGVPFGGGSGKYKWCIQDNGGSAPANLTFTPANFCDNSSGCTSNCCPCATWGQQDNISITGKPSLNSMGSYSLTFVVKDNNPNTPNIASKTIVLSVYP